MLVQPNLITPNINTARMATFSQPAGPSDEGPPYRSFKELRGDPTVAVVFSPAAQRLFWPLDGVFPTALSVMKTSCSANDLEPYFQQTLGGGIWHEIVQPPLTEPKVSSVEASVYDLEQWEFNWMAWHGHHEGADPVYVTYGDLGDEDRPYAAEPKKDGGWEERRTLSSSSDAAGRGPEACGHAGCGGSLRHGELRLGRRVRSNPIWLTMDNGSCASLAHGLAS